MPTLVSPGVSVTIIDESFYIPGRQATVPLIFIATADEKVQPTLDSNNTPLPALGTYEYGKVREVTSIKSSVELYGVPRFLESAEGKAHHGDARNEYGLDALNKYLEIGNRAYVVRGNVNLADDLPSTKALWARKSGDAADYLNVLVEDFMVEYNSINNLVTADAGYKESVTPAELKPLTDEALSDALGCFSFSSDQFHDDFILDHQIDHAGYQEVLYDTSGGFLQTTDTTGLNNDTTVYGFEVQIDTLAGVVPVTVTGSSAQTFGDLIVAIQADLTVGAVFASTGLTGSATVALVQGNIRITSDLLGATSLIDIVDDGQSGTLALFSNTSLFEQFGVGVAGRGISSLGIYDDTFTTLLVGGYDGLDYLMTSWSSGMVVVGEFTADEAEGLLLAAAADFDNTKEYLNATSLGANDALRRAVIVQQMQAIINDPNVNVRGENLLYNLTLCPGYWETSDELVRLSQDMFEEVFVIGETPFDKPPTGPLGVVNWATSSQRVTSYHISYYYPHGISSNIDGVNIMTSAASTALRVYAFNDAEAEVFYAPAGVARGTCPHLTEIGYVSGTLGGPTDFIRNDIDNGTRDSLYESPKKINPISFIVGRGILVMGQKTTYGATSSLESTNVSRLLKLIKRELRLGLFPYLFDPNDGLTRENVKARVDSFLGELIERRGLYDFATLVDETNNTPDRIQAKELWADIAIKPTLAAEFIYVPIRVVHTGADIGGRSIIVGQ